MTTRWRGILARLALLAAAIIWGSSFFIIKDTVNTLPPAFLQAIRFSFGALLLALVFIKRVRRLNARDWARGFLIGAVLAAASLVQNIGLMDTTPGKNAFLTAVYCVVVPFLYWLTQGKRPEGKRFLAAFVCLLGIALVSLTETLNIGKGDLLTLASGFLYACHILAIGVYGRGMDPIGLTVAQFTGAATLQWLYALIFETIPASIDFSVVPQILYLALFSTTLGYLLQVIGQKYASPSASSLILSLESVFGVLFSVMFYGETLTLRLALGFFIIFVSVLISEVEWKRPIRLATVFAKK